MSRLVSLWLLHLATPQQHSSHPQPEKWGAQMCPIYHPGHSNTGNCGIQLLICLPRHRMPREQWWLNLRLMLKMLAHYRISMADYVSGELEHVTRRTLSIDKGF